MRHIVPKVSMTAPNCDAVINRSKGFVHLASSRLHLCSAVSQLPIACVQGARGHHLTASAIIIQAAFRGLAARRELKRGRRAASRIQVPNIATILAAACRETVLA